MNPQKVMEALLKAQCDLTKLNDNYKNFGIQKEKAERTYRMELRKKLIQLRAEKTPSSMVQDLAKGDERISQLRLERGLAENNYFTCKEAMNNKRSEIESLRSILTWQRVELVNS